MSKPRYIRVGEDTWNKMAEYGKFGDSNEDVLRRVLGLPPLERGKPTSQEPDENEIENEDDSDAETSQA